MLKYIETAVTFREIPDEVTLCINITNCPNNCPDCHSPYLAEDTGEYLTIPAVIELIEENDGITAISFMGGDSEPSYVNKVAGFVRENYPKLKICWYSGAETISKDIDIINFDYIKVGPYDSKLGGLDSETTNQKMFKVEEYIDDLGPTFDLVDITHKFRK